MDRDDVLRKMENYINYKIGSGHFYDDATTLSTSIALPSGNSWSPADVVQLIDDIREVVEDQYALVENSNARITLLTSSFILSVIYGIEDGL